MCRAHDDQWEARTARVISMERDDTPGELAIHDNTGKLFAIYPYAYRVFLVCRHVSLKRLDAEGGPAYRWHRFPWNGVVRYLLGEGQEQ